MSQKQVFELVYGGVPVDKAWATETIVYKEFIKKNNIVIK